MELVLESMRDRHARSPGRWLRWRAAALALPLCAPAFLTAQTRPTTPPGLIGSWGGEHIGMRVTSTGASLEYDCASGTIDEPLRPDEKGSFAASGTHTYLSGGPGEPGARPARRHPARLEGWTDGRRMRLTVTIQESGREVGRFELELGRRPQLERCH